MDNYLNNTTNGQHYYINGKHVSITSNEANTVNFKSDNQYYAITNNFNYLPQPEIANAHQVSYQDQYKNNNYFSNNNNLYNINTNLNTNNVINNNYDYKLKPNQVYMTQNNNSNNYQNNYALVTPINTRQNPFTSLNSTYIQHNTINISNQNISTNIDNNLGINANNPYNCLNYQTNTNIQIKNKQNILSNESNISNDKNEEKEKTDPYNIKGGYDSIQLDILNSNKVALNIIKKEESGDFLCPKCGHIEKIMVLIKLYFMEKILWVILFSMERWKKNIILNTMIQTIHVESKEVFISMRIQNCKSKVIIPLNIVGKKHLQIKNGINI